MHDVEFIVFQELRNIQYPLHMMLKVGSFSAVYVHFTETVSQSYQ